MSRAVMAYMWIGGGGGLSQDAADERYVQRGSTIKLP